MWYHGHFGGLRADGAFGLFIVHKRVPEIPYYPFLVNHWIHLPFYEYMITNPYKKLNQGAIAGPAQQTYSFEHLKMKEPRAWSTIDGVRLSSMVFSSALINGRGQYRNNKAPIPWFTVQADSWNGFYMINPGVEYTFAISIDQHEMIVTSLGVGEVQPKTVDTAYLNPGERVNVRINTNKALGNYWIRSTTLDGQGEALAVLHYKGANRKEPETVPKKCSRQNPCVIYNCPSYDVPDEATRCLASFNFKGTERARSLARAVRHVDAELFLDFAFPIGASINAFRFVNPKNHLYSDNPMDKKCTRRECRKKGCYCTHYIGMSL